MTVKVTEADREAAASHWLRIGRVSERDAQNIRSGEWDHTQDILHFTQFRLAARKQALEEAARVADEQARRAWVIAEEMGQSSVCASGRNYGARDVAQAIRSLITDFPTPPESATQ